jgi:hypothetical protein
MTSRLLLVLSLLTLPVAMVALPPDPLWIHGLYDGGDYDDCLAMFESPSAGVTPPMPAKLAPPPPTGERVVRITTGGLSTRIALSTAPRSPPSA